MMFNHTFLSNVFRPILAAIFRVILQEYKGTNVASCVAVTL